LPSTSGRNSALLHTYLPYALNLSDDTLELCLHVNFPLPNHHASLTPESLTNRLSLPPRRGHSFSATRSQVTGGPEKLVSEPATLLCSPGFAIKSASPTSSTTPAREIPFASLFTMDQWGAYSDSAGASRRYNGNAPPNQPPSQSSRDYNGGSQSQSQSQTPGGFNYDQYQGGMASHPQSVTASPISTPNMRDGNGDVSMSDAGDPYNTMKYPMRPHHQQHLSSSRLASQHSPGEAPSAAAQRYSPMETLSPTSPYGTAQAQNQYSAQVASQRQSPTRPGNYPSPNSYYTGRQQPQQLPPITPYSSNNSNESYPNSATAQLNAVFGNDPKAQRRPGQQSLDGPPGRGPVPEFSKVRQATDLRPKINAQPAFRRANPEGGFISVCLLKAKMYDPKLIL